MAKFTTELKTLIDSNYPLGLDKYEIFDEEYRGVLNAKIINHFYFREIGFETAGLFVFKLNSKMNEIMPYYNKLYESMRIKYDPLRTYQFHQEKVGGEQENNTTGTTSKNKIVESDTPQGMLSINDIEDETYASRATFSNNNSDIDFDGNLSRNETIDAYGSIAGTAFSDLIKKYRESLVNVDEMIFERLEPLFMQIWDY